MDSEVAEILRLCRALDDDDWVQGQTVLWMRLRHKKQKSFAATASERPSTGLDGNVEKIEGLSGFGIMFLKSAVPYVYE